MKLRIGLVISGAVSLGAYEGGALAALLVALEHLRDDVVIDVITGASAGAITGLVASRCLVTGADPVDSMIKAWVELPDLTGLATHDDGSPLSGQALAKGAVGILGPDGPAGSDNRQIEPIRLSMAMVHLGGLAYTITGLEATTAVDAITYLDWADATFGPDSPADAYIVASQAALASGANAAGFPPKLVKRTAEAIEKMKNAGLSNVPGPDGAWYTDGGTIDNEPFGRMLDLLGDTSFDGADDDGRLLLMVHPLPASVPDHSAWTDATSRPRWTPTAMRAFGLQNDQRVFDDLQALTKVNTRLQWVETVVSAIATSIDALATTDPTAAEAARAHLTQGLVDAIATLDAEHSALNDKIGRKPNPRPAAATGDLEELARHAIHRATGLSGKKTALVEIVSPALDDSGASPDKLLAGEKLGHFFGFLAPRFRQSDFSLGYRHMRTWLTSHLPAAAERAGVTGLDVSAAVAAVQAGYDSLPWPEKSYGDATFKDLSIGEKLHLAGLGAHVAHMAESDVRHWHDGLAVLTD